DVHGYLQVSHTGGLMGIVSQVTLIPELDLGIVVLTNQQSGAAFMAITNSIKDGYFGITGKNRITQYHEARLKAEKRAQKITANVKADIAKQLAKNTTVEVANYVGLYEDPWFGQVEVTKTADGRLRFRALRSPDLVGTMTYYKGTTFVVRWDKRFLKADAFVNFSLD